MLLTRFRCFFFWIWVNHFCLFRVYLILVYHSGQLVILGQISATCSESWYQKLEFCVTSFWFYYHRFWWSSWYAMLSIFLLYIFLVLIFSWRDLFQVKETDASCVHYIICSQFTTFEQVTLYSACCAWFVAFLASPDAVLLRTSTYLFLAQFGSSVYIRLQFWVALTCSKLALRTVIMVFHRLLSLLLKLKVIAPI